MNLRNIKWLPQAALGVVLLTLSYLVFTGDGGDAKKKEEDEKKRILAINDLHISHIRVVSSDVEYEFECLDLKEELCKPGEHSNWRMVKPNRLSADKAHVNQLLSSINNARAKDIIDLTSEDAPRRKQLLEEYLLADSFRNAPGSRRVELTSQNGQTFVAWFGGAHPMNEDIFVATAVDGKLLEDKIFVLPKQLKSNFEHDLNYWRDKRLFDVPSHRVDAFELVSGSKTIKGQKTEGKWTLLTGGKKPRSYAGNTEAIDLIITSAVNAAAKEIAFEDKGGTAAKSSIRGMDKILSLTLRVQSEKKREGGEKTESEAQSTNYELAIFQKKGAKKGDKDQVLALVSGSDPVFELNPNLIERLDKDLKDLRTKRLLTSIERYKANRIEVTGRVIGENPLVLVKDDKTSVWKNAAEGAPALDSEKVQSLLDKLAANHISEFLEGRQVPERTDESVVISLGDNEAPSKKKFEFWTKDQTVYVRDLYSDAREAFKLDNVMKASLPESRSSFDLGHDEGKPRINLKKEGELGPEDENG